MKISNKFLKCLIITIICASLISNSASWALGGIDIPSNLAPGTSATASVEEFRDTASALSITKSLIRWGITSNQGLEESIWKSLVNDRYERLTEIGYIDGKRCLIFKDSRGGRAYYLFSEDTPAFYRITDRKDVSDPFCNLIGDLKDNVVEVYIDGKKHYKQSFVTTQGTYEFIISCIQTLYPEWEFSCRIPVGGNILKWEGVTDRERLSARERIIKRIFRKQKKRNNEFVSGKVGDVIPVIKQAIGEIKPEVMNETLETVVNQMVDIAKRQRVLTERKVRLILEELASLGDWAKRITLGEFLSMAVDKLENTEKIGFSGFIEREDRFFLGGAVNRKGRDYLLYDVPFLRHLSGHGRGTSEYLISEYLMHEVMELVCESHQIIRLISMLVFPVNYRRFSERANRWVYEPKLRKAIRTFIVLNTFDFKPSRGTFWDWLKGLFVFIILLTPVIAYGKEIATIVIGNIAWIVITIGIILGVILGFIVVARYIKQAEKKKIEKIIREIIEDTVVKFPPDKDGQCVGAAIYIEERINSECRGMHASSKSIYLPFYLSNPFYLISDTTSFHEVVEVKIGGERFIIDTQLKQIASEFNFPEGFIEEYIYPWDEYFVTIPAYEAGVCVDRILPEFLADIVRSFWGWADTHKAGETTVMEAYEYLRSIIGESKVIIERGIRSIYQETIFKYFESSDKRKFAKGLMLAARDYRDLGMDLDSIMCNEYAGRFYYELADRNNAITSLYNAARGYNRLGMYDKAIECCERIISICELCGDRQAEAWIRAVTANNYRMAGKLALAGDGYVRSGRIYRDVGKLNDARRMFGQAIRCYEKAEMADTVEELQRAIDELERSSPPHVLGEPAREEFLFDKDRPGEFMTGVPEGLGMALKRVTDKYGPGIIIPLDGVKLESGIPGGEMILEGRWIKICPETIEDSEVLFQALEKGFLQRILLVVGGDKRKLKDAISVYTDVIMARNAIDPAKRIEVETKIKLILSGLTLGQLRFFTALRDYKGLPEVVEKGQPRYMRLDIEKIDDECLSTIRDLMKYTRDGIKLDKPMPGQDRLFLFSFYSSSNQDVERWLTNHKLGQDRIEGIKMGITLLSPDKLREESRDPKDKKYLVLPYGRKSILMAADLVLNYENIEHSEVYGVIKILYKELIGREPNKDDILKLIQYPWLVLPEPEVLSAFFNGLIKAEEILMSSA